MTEITAKIIKHSINESGNNLFTFELTYPRFILAELNTHRNFSRGSSSSRAVPVSKVLENVRTDPAVPVFWGKNQPWMSAETELSETEKEAAESVWRDSSRMMSDKLEEFQKLNVHKSRFLSR